MRPARPDHWSRVRGPPGSLLSRVLGAGHNGGHEIPPSDTYDRRDAVLRRVLVVTDRMRLIRERDTAVENEELGAKSAANRVADVWEAFESLAKAFRHVQERNTALEQRLQAARTGESKPPRH